MGKRALVTGSSSRLSASLLDALARHPLVERVVGIDSAPAAAAEDGKLKFYKADIRDEFLLRSIMEEEAVDTVFHLAQACDSPADEVRAREAHVSGTLTVLEAASKSSTPRRLIIAGSTLAYGARRRNPATISEDQPLRASSLRFAAHKRLMEDELAKSLPQARKSLGVAVLRLCALEDGGLAKALRERPRLYSVLFRKGLLQFLAASDLTNVLLRAMEAGDLRGTFNVAPDDSVSVAELAGALGKARIPMPYSLLWLCLFIGRRLFSPRIMDERLVGYLAYCPIASNEKIKRALGVTFEKRSLTAFLEYTRTAGLDGSK